MFVSESILYIYWHISDGPFNDAMIARSKKLGHSLSLYVKLEAEASILLP
jgi:hypothetical protein